MSRDKEKKPVLTSPWKIGVFVALMLVVTGLGVGYYMADIYSIDLKWISVGSSGWQIDSFLFFKEMYPLVAAVVLVALVCYFLIASAVRRYKYYLDSGQDYRKMISLAESIDDLTNPAQIAKLSDYPELQEILRNYGDQIREISRDIEEARNEGDTMELENLITSILEGEEVAQGAGAGKWYSGIYEKVRDYVGESRREVEELKKMVDLARTVSGRAALMIGKVGEGVKKIEAEIEKIVAAVEGLRSQSIENGVGGGHSEVPGGEDLLNGLMADMQTSIGRLREIASSFGDFSNENNNLALSLALTAAKGRVPEGELARYAEKIRSSAEGFNGMSRAVGEISDALSRGIQTLKEGFSGIGAVRSGNVDVAVGELADLVSGLKSDLGVVVGDIAEIERILKEGAKELSMGGLETGGVESGKREESERIWNEDGGLLKGEVNLGGGVAGGSSGIKIERNDEWDDEAMFVNIEGGGERSGGGLIDDPLQVGGTGEPGMFGGTGDGAGRIDDGVEGRDEGRIEEPEAADEDNLAREAEEEVEGWMDMPGHRWIEVNVKESEAGVADSVDVEVPAAGPGRGASEQSLDDVEVRSDEQLRAEEPMDESPADGGHLDEEPVYDLFELGAVEIK